MSISRSFIRSTWACTRTVSTSSASSIQLDYTPVIPSNGNEKEGPLVILHGLFGSRKNWSSLSKSFAKELDRPVYCLDLRNHGTSPHSSPMNYTSMASDVLRFIEENKLKDVNLLGHSMGGKVAMALALSPSNPPLSSLIVADIAPSKGKLSPEFMTYVEAMKKIEDAQVTNRQDASKILHQYEEDPNIVAFLLTNLLTPKDEPAKFRVPLDLIGGSIHEIGDFPYDPEHRTWEGRTMFVKGLKSKFINRHNEHLLSSFFPDMKLETLDASHWVHAERPEEFKKLVCDFIRDQ